MSSSQTVNIAVVGAGLIGRRHIQHVREEPLTTLAAVVEPSPAGKELAASIGVPCYASVDDLLSSRQRGEIAVDGAIVGTPTHTHVPLAIQLMRARIHVLVEKPVAPSAKEGEALMEALKVSDGKVKVLVGQHRRFNPYIVALKSALDSGKLGTILGIQGTWAVRKGPSEYYEGWHGVRSQGGGTVSINMIHDVDLLRHLMGDVDSVFCLEGNRTRGLDVEETGGVVMRFKSGAVGTFFFSDAAASPFCFEGATGENPDVVGKPYGKDIYHVFGTKGTISLPSLVLHHYPTQDPVPVSTSISNKGGETDNWLFRLAGDNTYARMAAELVDTPPFTLQLRHFVGVISGREEPNCSAEEGWKSVRTVEALTESMVATSDQPGICRGLHNVTNAIP